MSLDEIGRRFGVRTLDIHAGGVDLIFPHHEDEIAQSEAVTGEPFARYWVHGAFMQVGGTKMSKRFGNFLTVRDLQEEGVDAGTFRLLVFQTHYRKELDYNDAALASARDGSRRLDIFRDRLRTAGGLQEDEPFRALAETLKTRVTEALNDDLNAPRAVAALFDFVTEGNRLLDTGVRPGERVLAAWRWVDAVLDLCPTPPPVDDELVRWVEERIAARTRARGARDFKEADRIREELRARGVEIEDTPGGTKWRRA